MLTNKNDFDAAVVAFLATQAARKKTDDEEAGVDGKAESYDDFMRRVGASLAFFRANDKLSLGTHIARGIHSALRSSNAVVHVVGEKPGDWVSTASVPNPVLDATSDQPALHGGHLKNVLDFLNLNVGGKRIWRTMLDAAGKEEQLVLDVLVAVLGDRESASDMLSWLRKKMTVIECPSAGGQSKQLFFPVAEGHDAYHVLIPLYPAAMAHYVYGRVNAVRFGGGPEERKSGYKTMPGLAKLRIGGNNSQNVSRLNNVQHGRHYMIPSLPPEYVRRDRFDMKPDTVSFFGGRLYRMCRDEFAALFDVVREFDNTSAVRDMRKLAIERILDKVVWLAIGIQDANPPGWSRSMRRMPFDELLWLDPGRAELTGEEDFARWRDGDEWKRRIALRFHNWLNGVLKREFQDVDFDRAVPTQWRAAIGKLLDRGVIA